MYDGGSTVAVMRDWRKGASVAAAVQGADNWIHGAAYDTPDANAEFIANAPADIRHLLAAVDTLRQQVETLTEDLAQSRAETEVADACTEKKVREMEIIWQRMLDEKRKREAAEAQVETLTTEKARLRAVLAGLVGSDGREELEPLEAALRLMPMPAEDRAKTIDAIHALIASLP